MSKYAYRYPDGAIGIALLFVRVSYAFVVFGVAATTPKIPVSPHLLHLAAGLAALFLVIGLATRLTAVLLGIAVATVLTMSAPVEQLLLAGHVGGCTAIALMGAGAFSIDARRHGRRVIRLQSTPGSRG